MGPAAATPEVATISKAAYASRPIDNDDNPAPPMHKQVLRLAGFLACVALATSRIGLIAHELVAHGGAALAVGAEIQKVEMFWFAGGWIRYRFDEPSLTAAVIIAMAGIALEVVVGLAL